MDLKSQTSRPGWKRALVTWEHCSHWYFSSWGFLRLIIECSLIPSKYDDSCFVLLSYENVSPFHCLASISFLKGIIHSFFSNKFAVVSNLTERFVSQFLWKKILLCSCKHLELPFCSKCGKFTLPCLFLEGWSLSEESVLEKGQYNKPYSLIIVSNATLMQTSKK